MRDNTRIFIITVALMLFGVAPTALAHGGGCRKADRPLCCHMDNRVGAVRCH